jgi:DNA polymerase I-like protein with 3'-5' exonuclease and polymerase domains
MTSRQKNYHVGGEQLPLITPTSAWRAPLELPDLRRCRRIALDRETKDDGLAGGRGPGWAYGAGFVCGTSIAWEDGGKIRSFYAPVRHPDTECFDGDRVAQWEKDHIRAGVRFVMQNAPYDVGWGNCQWKIPVPDKIDDVICMANVVDENRLSYKLDDLCKWRGLPGKDETLLHEALSAYGYPKREDAKKNLWRLPARYVGPYAEIDAVRTMQLASSLQPEIERQGVGDAYQLEMDLLPLVHEMRRRGVRVDLEAAALAKAHCQKVAAIAFSDLSEKLGHTVGIDEARSNSWLERAFTEQKVRFPKDEKNGRGSFEAKWMKNDPHWLPQLLVRAKSYHDAAEKFIQTFIMDFAHNGRLHASINQFKSEEGGTRTCRFSYADPPLQQMPKRDDELAAIVRGLFLPEPGELWFSADYSQQEYRLIVHFAERMGLSKAKEAADKYRADPRTDFHSMVAEMTGLERKPAKDSNFAKSYGAGIPKFASMINKSVEEARAIMEQYDRELPFNKELNERCQSSAERLGYVLLLDRAKIHFDFWEPAWLSKEERDRGWSSGGKIKMAPCGVEEAAERKKNPDHPWYGKRLRRANCRKAMNGKIQGSAARQTKMAMRACWREKLVPVLQMHDELAFSLRTESEGKRIGDIMRDIIALNVPMQVDEEWGISWGAANKTTDKKTKAVTYDASYGAASAARAALAKGKSADRPRSRRRA